MKNEILESRVQATPIGDFNWQSKPIDPNNCYLISQDEIEKLGKHELKWSTEEYEEDGETKTRPILIENDPTEENTRNLAVKRIAELKKYLSETDYEAIKFAEGELSEEDFAPYKANRRRWREEINELEESLR